MQGFRPNEATGLSTKALILSPMDLPSVVTAFILHTNAVKALTVHGSLSGC